MQDSRRELLMQRIQLRKALKIHCDNFCVLNIYLYLLYIYIYITLACIIFEESFLYTEYSWVRL